MSHASNGHRHALTTHDELTALAANAFVRYHAAPAPLPRHSSPTPRRDPRIDNLVVNLLTARLDRMRRQADPRRDVSAECGHPTTFSIEQYQDLFDTNGIADRVVRVHAEETWKVTPWVYENESTSEATAFEAAWDALGTQLRGGSKLVQEEGSPVWDALKAVDVECGIGRYGVVLLGLDDDAPLSQPAAPRAGQRLLYLRSIPEAYASATKWETNKRSPRYGQPTEYDVSFGDPEDTDDGVSTEPVHWTRLIHVCDGTGPVYARPRLRNVLPYVLDAWKVLGSDAEAFWQNVTGDTYFESDPSLGGDVEIDTTGTKDEYEKMLQGLQRGMILNGLSAKKLLPQMADPLPHFMAQINAICIAKDVPHRTFMGSELGRLAADQDASKWAATCRARRRNHVTPRVIGAFVDRLVWLGVLPEPKEYHVGWPDAETQTEEDKAKVALTLTQALAAYVQSGAEAVMTPVDYLCHVWGWEEEQAAAVMENTEGMLAEMRAEQAAAQEEARLAMQQGQGNGGADDDDAAQE